MVVREKDGTQKARFYGDISKKKTTLREYARKVTDNCFAQIDILHAISTMQPFIIELPDGRQSPPIIPTVENARQASKDLIELVHGKAPNQLDVLKAEEEAQLIEQIRALSDKELHEKALKFLGAQGMSELTEGEIVSDSED